MIAEALAHGVPVIASKGTPWSRIEEIGCGLVVENDPESLAKAILKMFSLPRKEMGIKGREWMSKEFGLKIMTDKMIKCYKDLLENQK